MTKQPVKKTPKAKTVKKTKAKQIIKQKVVVNVTSPPRRRGRPRKLSESEKRGPVPKGETFLISKGAEKQYYDAERAGKKYADEMKKELLQLKADQDNETKKQLEMQQQALLMQMYQGQQQKKNDDELETYKTLPAEAFDIQEKIIDAEAEAKKLKAEIAKINRRAGMAVAREAKKKNAENLEAYHLVELEREKRKAAMEAEERTRSQIALEKQAEKEAKAAKRAAKKAATEEAAQKLLKEQEEARKLANKGGKGKKGK